MTKYLAIGCAILALLCVTMFYRGQVYRAKFKAEKAEVARLIVSNNSQEGVIAKERKSCAKAIAFRDEKLKEALEMPKCEIVKIEGCPEIKIEEKAEKDSFFDKMLKMWRW